MTNSVNFDDYLRQQLKDPEFKEEFENEILGWKVLLP